MNTMKKFIPPTVEEVIKYQKDNPELCYIDPVDFFKGYNDGDWIDTRGNPVRNWKLKMRTRNNFARERKKCGQLPKKKIRLFPIKGKICSEKDCGMPAVFKTVSGAGYEFYKCSNHLPNKVKAKYE